MSEHREDCKGPGEACRCEPPIAQSPTCCCYCLTPLDQWGVEITMADGRFFHTACEDAPPCSVCRKRVIGWVGDGLAVHAGCRPTVPTFTGRITTPTMSPPTGPTPEQWAALAESTERTRQALVDAARAFSDAALTFADRMAEALPEGDDRG